MVKVLSPDLRDRVVPAIDGGMWRRQVAERFGVGIATATCWVRLAGEKGSPAPDHAEKRPGMRWSRTTRTSCPEAAS